MNNWITICGDAQSGSTIVSAILDSHPNVRLANEQRLISRWKLRGWSKEQILECVLKSGQGSFRKTMALPGSGNWTTRENQDSLLAIGDKYGHDLLRVAKREGLDVGLLAEFGEFIGLPIKLIHTIRNPYDNISAQLDHPRRIKETDEIYDWSICRYEELYEIIDPVLNRYSHFNLHNDSLIKDPRWVLTELCGYLEIPVVEPWLTTAVDAVFTKPHNRKDNREWLSGAKKDIEVRLIDKYPYFNRYKEPGLE